ncbi:glycerate-and formate-dehydrogenase [Tremella mesenterica]|uniref:Glycerate-and formate-dehydrogenase n=1 Tax=Tremella mesenterica TaxID=5217 RepID=A0A4Q1BJJ5_TREME|nr:glycerate-and formate-dehydrogenase [Tremella mesenterica]
MTVTSRRKILGIGYPRLALPEWQELADKYDIHWFVPGDRPQVIGEVKRLCEEHGPFDAAYVTFGTSAFSPFHRDMLGPLFSPSGHCGLFAQGGAGYDDVDYPWLAENGCYLSNTPNAVTEATADMGILLMLSALRGSTLSEKSIRDGNWKDKIPLSEDPMHKTLGIVGMGHIGKSMAKKSKAWDMKVIYYNRRRLPEDEEKALGATWVPFDELLRTSDVISLNCPLTPETKGLLGDKEFAKMKDGVYIVNTARGPVIQDDALIRALDSGKVCRAGLDVFTVEPCRESPYFSRTDVTLQPHVGGLTTGTILRGEREIFANVKQ